MNDSTAVQATARFAKVLLPALMLLASAAGFNYLKASRPEVLPNPPQERVWTVSTAPIAYQDVQSAIKVYGEAVAGRDVELRPLVDGRIVEVAPKLLDGAVVKRDEVLLVVDPFHYESEVAEHAAKLKESNARLSEIKAELKAERELLTVAEEQFELLQRDLERMRRLRDGGTVSEKTFDDAKMALKAGEQTVITRRRGIARSLARAAQQEALVEQANVALERARRDLDDTRLRAPFDGFLAGVDAAVGMRVTRNDRIARIIDAHSLEAKFELTDRDFARLLNDVETPRGSRRDGLRGRPVTVRWRLGDAVFTYPAVIDRFGAEIDAASGGVHVYARMTREAFPTPLRPGAFVEIEVPGRRYRQAVRVPDAAVSDEGLVYIIDGDRLRAQRVEVMAREGEDLVLRGDLPGGGLIVADAFPGLADGIRVRIGE